MECLKIRNEWKKFSEPEIKIEVHHDLEDVEVPVYERVFYTLNEIGQIVKHETRQEVQTGYIKLKRCKHCHQLFLPEEG